MKKGKKLILTIALMACMGGLAAHSDGFFSSGDMGGRDATGLSSGNEYFGMDGYSTTEHFNTTDAPLGSGIAVLTMLGAGYALMRKRRD